MASADFKTFLLADDDMDDKSLFCEALLEVDPATVCYTASDGKEALAILADPANTKPDIVFLDVNMPVMDGWQCLRRLKQSTELSSIPVIMYSTSSYQRDIDMALENGAYCFLTKPSDYRELRIILRLIATRPIASLPDELASFGNVRFRQ